MQNQGTLKKNLIILLFIIVPFQANVSGQQIYDTNMTDTDGRSVTLADLKGEKLTVVDFWATWCKPCLVSIPQLVKLNDEFGQKGVNFIGINEDGPRNIAKVKPFAFSKGITYPVLMDSDQQLMSDLMVSALPTLIILDKNGRVLYTHEGYSYGDENVIKAKISDLLAEMD